jgi:hypothetical protein
MLLATRSNAAAYCAFHFSAETERMHQESRRHQMVQKACKSHMDLQSYPEEWQLSGWVECKHLLEKWHRMVVYEVQKRDKELQLTVFDNRV